MVVSEIVAATMIAVCGLKKSYRIVLRGERFVRRQIFIRHVFKAGHHIAVRWEGRAQNAAQTARAARLRAAEARDRVADVSADVRARAEEARSKVADVSVGIRARAEEARERARDGAARVQETAAVARQRLQDARARLDAARGAASEAAERVSAAAGRVRERLPERFGAGATRGIADALEGAKDEEVRGESKGGDAPAESHAAADKQQKL